MHRLSPLTAIAVIAIALATISSASATAEKKEELNVLDVEVLWDEWGVPHIFAPTLEGAGYGFGWAHAKSHGTLLLQLYGQARGRSSEYWGQQYTTLDTKIWSDRVPQTAERFYETMDPETTLLCEAFAQGFNDHVEAFPDEIEDKWKVVLPLSGLDVFRHGYRVLFAFTFSGVSGMRATYLEDFDLEKDHFRAHETETTHYSAYADYDVFGDVPEELKGVIGSNAWAINSNSGRASGPAKLVMNPHLPWALFFRWYEAHIVIADEDFDFYGSNLIGIPVLNVGFNKFLGFSHTVNVHRAFTAYEIELVGDDAYMFDGEVLPLQRDSYSFLVKKLDGTMEEHTVIVESTVHGAVYARTGATALVARLAKVDSPADQIDPMKQWWEMGRARNKDEFIKALEMNQMPMFTTIYADRDDNIIHTSLGFVPDRSDIGGDWNYWGRAVNGSTSATLWMDVHEFHDLYYAENPPSGYLQNANEPPWTTTLPLYFEHPSDYPPYLTNTPTMSNRAQTSARLLETASGITLDKFVELKHSADVEQAHHSLDDLLGACDLYADDVITRQACTVLENWDRQLDVDSRGADLFMLWHQSDIYVNGWSDSDPLGTPNTLRDPQGAVERLRTVASGIVASNRTLDEAYGDTHRFPNFRDEPAYPGNGGSDCFRCMYFLIPVPSSNALMPGGGDTFYGAVEFSDPPKAKGLIATGNSSQRSSEFGRRHWFDQSEFMSKKELRDLLVARADIEAHLDFKEDIQYLSRASPAQPKPVVLA